MTAQLAEKKSGEDSAPASRYERAHVISLLEKYSLPALLLVVVLFFSIYPPSSEIYPTVGNFNIVVSNQSVLAILALGSLAPLVCGQFDLSVGAILGCSSVVTAAAISDFGLPIPVALVLGVLFGTVIGLINGYLVAYVGVNAFIGTLGMSTIIIGLAIAYSPSPLIDIPESITTFGRFKVGGISILVPLVLLLAVAIYYFLDYTPAGRRLIAVGSSRSAAALVGISVRRTVMGSFVLSGTLAGLAGILQVARSGSADVAVGNSLLLPALAAAFLGATAIRPGRFNVVGTLVAIVFLAASVSGLTLSGVEPWIGEVFTGASLVAGVSISALIRGRDAKT